MKATSLLIAVVLSLQVTNLFAHNDFPPVLLNNEANVLYCVALDPTTPKEATFDDAVTVSDFSGLMPVTPVEATFDDAVDSGDAQIFRILFPVTPNAAGFNDDEFNQAVDLKILAPTTPAEADFE